MPRSKAWVPMKMALTPRSLRRSTVSSKPSSTRETTGTWMPMSEFTNAQRRTARGYHSRSAEQARGQHAGHDQPDREQAPERDRVAVEHDAERDGAHRADAREHRVGGADRQLAHGSAEQPDRGDPER